MDIQKAEKELEKAQGALRKVKQRRAEVLQQLKLKKSEATQRRGELGKFILEGGDVEEVTSQAVRSEREIDAIGQALEEAEQREASLAQAVKDAEYQLAKAQIEKAILDVAELLEEAGPIYEQLEAKAGEILEIHKGALRDYHKAAPWGRAGTGRSEYKTKVQTLRLGADVMNRSVKAFEKFMK
jgi:DNA repair exonuclease SbcCD ATPase subunit